VVLELVGELPVAGIERCARRGYAERRASFTARNELEGAAAGITEPRALPGGGWSAGAALGCEEGLASTDVASPTLVRAPYYICGRAFFK
jgi:hypothetical protein